MFPNLQPVDASGSLEILSRVHTILENNLFASTFQPLQYLEIKSKYFKHNFYKIIKKNKNYETLS